MMEETAPDMIGTGLLSRFGIRRLTLAVGITGIGFVWANALLWQSGPHPAPLFGNAEPEHAALGQDMEFLAARDYDIPLSRLTKQARERLIGELQTSLKRLGYYTGIVDGIEGPMTRGAVSAFETAMGLPASGTISYTIYRKIRLSAHEVSEVQPNVPMAGDQQRVYSVQRVLSNLGFRPGPVNGQFTVTTGDAIRRFETSRGMPLTGQISDVMVRELTSISGVQIDPES